MHIQGDARSFKKVAYRLQTHAIRLGAEMWWMSRKQERLRLLHPAALASDRWEVLTTLLETKVGQRRREMDAVEMCVKCKACPAETYGGADGEQPLCEPCWKILEQGEQGSS